MPKVLASEKGSARSVSALSAVPVSIASAEIEATAIGDNRPIIINFLIGFIFVFFMLNPLKIHGRYALT